MNCTGCWNYSNCENKDREDLVACFRKGYTCKYCNRVECKFYDTERRCVCSEFIEKANLAFKE